VSVSLKHRNIIERLLKTHVTPFYLYDLESVNQRIRLLKSGIRLKRATVHYAMKANANPEILQLMRQNRCGVDVVSSGELACAIKVGFKPEQIIFSGVGKTKTDLRLAIQKKIKQINVESLQELERILMISKQLGHPAEVGLRINPNINAKTHPYITTGIRKNKFGINISDLTNIKKLLRDNTKYLKLRSLSIHIGSQITSLGAFSEAFKKVIELYKKMRMEGFLIERIDIGGGLGIDYYQEGHKDHVRIKQYTKLVNQAFKNLDVEVMLEPGRILVGRCGLLVTEIQYLKNNGPINFAIVDTGMHHLIRPALYQAYHRILPLRPHAGRKIKYNIVGPICESSDFLATARLLSPLHQGDILCVRDTGAYGFSMASTYNLQELPKEFCFSLKSKIL